MAQLGERAHKGQAASLPALVLAATSSSRWGFHGRRLPPLLPPWTLGQYLQGTPGLPLQHHIGGSPKSSETAPGVRGTASRTPCALAMGRWASSHAWGSQGTSPTCDGGCEKEETLWTAPAWERLQGAGEWDWGPPLPMSQSRQQPREELPKASSCFCSSLPLICGNQIFCPWNEDAHAPTRVLYPQTKACSSGCLTTSRPCLTRAPEQRWGSTGEEKPSLRTVEPRNIAQCRFPSLLLQRVQRGCSQIGGHGDCSDFLVFAGRWSQLRL